MGGMHGNLLYIPLACISEVIGERAILHPDDYQIHELAQQTCVGAPVVRQFYKMHLHNYEIQAGKAPCKVDWRVSRGLAHVLLIKHRPNRPTQTIRQCHRLMLHLTSSYHG